MASSHDHSVAPRGDLGCGIVLALVGAMIVIASWQMDRMEQQGATLYTAPGLWPGIIGLLIVVLGAALAWRSLARARASSWDAHAADDTELDARSRFALAVILFFVYAVLLVGHGIPFWIATTLFVATYVYVFRGPVPDRAGGRARRLIVAAVTGGLTALSVVLVFEQLFYVRLP